MRLTFYNTDLANILNGCRDVNDVIAFLEQYPECNNVSLEVDRTGELYQISHSSDRRGIIRRCDNNAVVCANMIASYCYDPQPKMNHRAYPAIVQDLHDGTLLRMYYHNRRWNLATNQCIDASRAFWNDNRSFADRFYEALRRDGVRIDHSKLHKYVTYFFVLSPDDHIVFTGSVRIRANGTFSYRAAGKGLELQSATAPHDSAGETDHAPYKVIYNQKALWKHMMSISPDSVGLAIHMKHFPYHQIIYTNPSYIRRKQIEYLEGVEEYGKFCRQVWNDDAVLKQTADILFDFMTKYYVEKTGHIPKDIYQTRILPKLWNAVGSSTDDGDTIGADYILQILCDMAKRDAKSCERIYHIHKICERYVVAPKSSSKTLLEMWKGSSDEEEQPIYGTRSTQ